MTSAETWAEQWRAIAKYSPNAMGAVLISFIRDIQQDAQKKQPVKISIDKRNGPALSLRCTDMPLYRGDAPPWDGPPRVLLPPRVKS